MYKIKLAEYRKAQGLTQKQLADMVGIHPTTLSKIENGRIYYSERIERKIIAALDIDDVDAYDVFGYPSPRRKLRLVR